MTDLSSRAVAKAPSFIGAAAAAGTLLGLVLVFVVRVVERPDWRVIVVSVLFCFGLTLLLVKRGPRAAVVAWVACGMIWGVMLISLHNMVEGDVRRFAQIIPFQFAVWCLVGGPFHVGQMVASWNASSRPDRIASLVATGFLLALLAVAWVVNGVPQEGQNVWVVGVATSWIAVGVFGLAPLLFAFWACRRSLMTVGSRSTPRADR